MNRCLTHKDVLRCALGNGLHLAIQDRQDNKRYPKQYHFLHNFIIGFYLVRVRNKPSFHVRSHHSPPSHFNDIVVSVKYYLNLWHDCDGVPNFAFGRLADVDFVVLPIVCFC